MNEYVFVFCTDEYESDDDVTMIPAPPEQKTEICNVVTTIIGVIANTLWILKSIL